MSVSTPSEFMKYVQKLCCHGFRPCPWCGSSRLYIGHHDWQSVGVQCLKCKTWGPVVSLPEESNLPHETMWRRMMGTAHRRWNRRADSQV